MSHEWKIRSMDEADSRAAVAAAERARITTAVWLGQAIREKLEREREPIPGEVVTTPPAEAEPSMAMLELALRAEHAPRWLRAGAAKRLGGLIGVNPPKGRGTPPRRLAAPGSGT